MRCIFISFLFSISIVSSSQVNIICPKLTDSSLNYFYIGVDNAMEIAGIKTSNMRVSISGGGAILITESPGRYIVRVNSETNDCRVTVAGTDGKIIVSKVFKVRTIPDMQLLLAGSQDTVIKKESLQIVPLLTLVSPGCFFKHNITIISFNIMFTFETSGGEYESNVLGNALPASMREQIEKLNSGDYVIIDKIKAMGPDIRTRLLASSLIVKIE